MSIDAAEIARRLAGPDSPARRALVALVVDAWLDRPASDVVDPSAISALVVEALNEDAARLWVERHGRPAFDRGRARLEARGILVGDLVPAGRLDELRALVRDGPGPSFGWAEGALDARLLRKLLAPVLQDALLGFVRKLPGAGLGGALAGRLLDGVPGVGRVSAGVDRRVQEAAKSFSRSTVAGLRAAILARLRTERGRELAAGLRARALEHVLGVSIADLATDLDRFPRERLDSLLPPLIAHAAAHPVVREALAHEIAAFLGVECGRPMRALLDDVGITEPARAEILRAADVVARAALEGPEFERWLVDLLAGEA